MVNPQSVIDRIFSISSEKDFNSLTLEVFKYQSENCEVYRKFLKLIKCNPDLITGITGIPFLPIELFKTHKVTCTDTNEIVFESSGTSGTTSKHFISSLDIYQKSLKNGFELAYGPIDQYHILALLPSYYSNTKSSLLYMVNQWLSITCQKPEDAFINNPDELKVKIDEYRDEKKLLIIGVAHSLLDFAEKHSVSDKNLTVMETGGMKGLKKEIIRSELHIRLKACFGVEQIHSEYGMTELLSQCYSQKDGVFKTPPWAKVFIRDTNDPMKLCPLNQTGGINIIDLANIYSCSFVATQDLGKKLNQNEFEMLGRFDNSDIRGCNLLVTGNE